MIKAVVFDLGGVLVELAPVTKVFDYVADEAESEFWQHWLHSDVVRRFETGNSTLNEFIADIKVELNLAMPHDDLIARHRGFVQGLYPGVFSLLDQLRNDYTLVSLSNNNPVHWPIMMSDYGLAEHFDFHFPSHETGLIKPDHNAFENVANCLELDSRQLLFIDDNQINVDAAKRSGLQAYQAKGIDAVRSVLMEQCGLIA